MKAFPILILLAALLVVGCGEKEEPAKEPKSQAKSGSKEEPVPEPKEDPAPEPTVEPAPESKEEPAPEPKEEPAPEPKPEPAEEPESSLSEREVDQLLVDAVEKGEALELRDDGNYYEKDQQTAYTGWVKQVSPEGRVRSLEHLFVNGERKP